MTDQALKDFAGPAGIPPSPGGRAIAPTRFGDKVISFTPARPEDDKPKGDARAGSAQPRDWSAAVDLIHEASEAIRIGQERASELEAHIDQVVAQATDEVRRLNAQIADGEQKLVRAEERARVAEARTVEAEAWLARLHDAVFSAFTPRRPSASQDSMPGPSGSGTTAE